MNKDDLKEQAENWQEQAQETAGELTDKARQWQQRAKEGAQKATRAADEYVHDSPWTIVASVALACFALGFLLANRRD